MNDNLHVDPRITTEQLEPALDGLTTDRWGVTFELKEEDGEKYVEVVVMVVLSDDVQMDMTTQAPNMEEAQAKVLGFYRQAIAPFLQYAPS